MTGELPAESISYLEAQQYCKHLSSLTKKKIRLPSEAEWKYAARGGLNEAPHPWGHEPPSPENCNVERRLPCPVASFPPNAFGLFEMIGNIQEWCTDFFRNDA